MLNMNRYSNGEGRFKYGLDFTGIAGAINRYANGHFRGYFSLLQFISAGTGHWPFTVLGFNFQTGALSNWEAVVLGLTFGSKTVHDIDEATGMLIGADKKMLYCFFSCINHRGKQIEEIINPTI